MFKKHWFLFIVLLLGVVPGPVLSVRESSHFESSLRKTIQTLEKENILQPSSIQSFHDRTAQYRTNRFKRLNLWVSDKLSYLGRFGRFLVRILEPVGYLLFTAFWGYVAYLIYMQSRGVLRKEQRKMSDVTVTPFPKKKERHVQEFLLLAEKYGKERKWKQAFHYLFSAFVLSLKKLHPFFRREHTAREIVFALGRMNVQPGVMGELKGILPLYERVRYGGYECSDQEWNIFYETIKRFINDMIQK